MTANMNALFAWANRRGQFFMPIKTGLDWQGSTAILQISITARTGSKTQLTFMKARITNFFNAANLWTLPLCFAI